MKGGIGSSLRISGVERQMFLSREIDIKPCQNYTKIIQKIIHVSFNK